MNCSIDCCICSALGGWDRSGMPPGIMEERREEMSGAEEEELSSDPPRGIVFHDEYDDVDFVMKVRLRR